MKLYGYWRSSAAYRVRIALNLKNIEVESIPVHLVKNGGEQHSLEYENLNPTHLVPTLVDGDLVLNQSLAIIEYLDNKFPVTPLYPNNYAEKAIVQGLTLDIACEIHPVNNLRVQQYLVNELNCDEPAKLQWSHYWMGKGFTALEKKLAKTAGLYCFGDIVTMADLCLVPQVYNANRFKLDMTSFPLINSIVERCNQLPAFIKSLPENQADAL
ncbi:maleylacetoacetate isomerase [Colwellia sp. 1_MG-2023]|uniref:maleylacetoacetate isomerase n=1 Tax=Colwellia sp. 1_MG-2023 TaxID=3062649 RepID=UPI0026E386E9|nr:maleylacetoacetate isomerase [Colwellia sp. 1_MG-2023]MDO6445711.1 maleylacetoacetate isomerase [Colwellia sp. 1_MG-2023]